MRRRPPPTGTRSTTPISCSSTCSSRLTGPVVLIGHSFGGRVAVRLAARRLPQIHGLVLMACPACRSRRSRATAVDAWRSGQLRRVADRR